MLTVAAACIFLLFQQRSDRARLKAQLADSRAVIEKLQRQISDLTKNQLSDSDLDRLRADQREAIRLRGDVTTLRQALAAAEHDANKAPAARFSNPQADAATLETASLPEGNPEVRVLKTRRISAQLPSGASLLIGGWESHSGKRVFALVAPKQDQSGSDAITVATKWIELPAEQAKQLWVGKYLDTSGEQTATLAQFSAEDFQKTFEKETGVDILSAPMISTLSGRQARISVTDSRPTAAGPVDFGQHLDIVPTLSSDGKINVTLQASIVLPREP